MSKQVATRLSAAEHAAFKRAADADGMNLRVAMRQAIHEFTARRHGFPRLGSGQSEGER